MSPGLEGWGGRVGNGAQAAVLGSRSLQQGEKSCTCRPEADGASDGGGLSDHLKSEFRTPKANEEVDSMAPFPESNRDAGLKSTGAVERIVRCRIKDNLGDFCGKAEFHRGCSWHNCEPTRKV